MVLAGWWAGGKEFIGKGAGKVPKKQRNKGTEFLISVAACGAGGNKTAPIRRRQGYGETSRTRLQLGFAVGWNAPFRRVFKLSVRGAPAPLQLRASGRDAASALLEFTRQPPGL